MSNFAKGCADQAARPMPATAGIGLRFPHHDIVIDRRPKVAWFEVHPENYLGRGIASHTLTDLRQSYPISLHATGLSLGSADGVDDAHLAAIAELCHRLEPILVSDHLSWSSTGGLFLPDLLPLPYTYEALDVIARNIDRVQTVLRRQILIENPSVYLALKDADMSESAFVRELIDRTGCKLLLDVNNLAVSAANLGQCAQQRLRAFLADISPQSIGEIHLAGHTIRELPGGRQLRIDDHGSAVSNEVWSLYQDLISQLGPRPTLIEWDTDIPAFEVLQTEAAIAQARLNQAVRSKEFAHAVFG